MAYTFLTSHDALIGSGGLVSSFVACLTTSLKSPFIFFPIVSLEAGSLRAAQKSLRQISRSACQKHVARFVWRRWMWSTMQPGDEAARLGGDLNFEGVILEMNLLRSLHDQEQFVTADTTISEKLTR
jgi:hypothetical protein